MASGTICVHYLNLAFQGFLTGHLLFLSKDHYTSGTSQFGVCQKRFSGSAASLVSQFLSKVFIPLVHGQYT
jgi:hypothetical protein